MALTATASDAIIRDVGMHNPVSIQVSPDKPNLLFGVKKVKELREEFMSLITRLKAERLSFGCTLIFCQCQLDSVDCSNLYHLFQLELEEKLTEPI